MADLAVSIVADALRVAPGSGVSFVVEVRNLGSVVDRYNCEIVGLDPAWWTVTPAAMELFPERDAAPDGRSRSDAPPSSGKFNVTIRPPRSPEARAGDWPIGAKVQSEHDPAGPGGRGDRRHDPPVRPARGGPRPVPGERPPERLDDRQRPQRRQPAGVVRGDRQRQGQVPQVRVRAAVGRARRRARTSRSSSGSARRRRSSSASR